MNPGSYLLLIGILLICLVLCILQYQRRNNYLKEVKRNNELETIFIIYAIKEELNKKDNMDIDKQLNGIRQSYVLPNLDNSRNPQDEERIQQEKRKLDNYLSILEICSLLAQTGSISRTQTHIILGDRLEDIKSHKELYEYICNSSYFYKDLIWLLKGNV